MIKEKTITEKEQRVIQWVSILSAKEIFGLKCFLAGVSVAVQESQVDARQFMLNKFA